MLETSSGNFFGGIFTMLETSSGIFKVLEISSGVFHGAGDFWDFHGAGNIWRFSRC